MVREPWGLAWGEAGSCNNGKKRRNFLYEGSQERKEGRLKQLLLVSLTENGLKAR